VVKEAKYKQMAAKAETFGVIIVVIDRTLNKGFTNLVVKIFSDGSSRQDSTSEMYAAAGH
jgi:hypothetical protein